MFLLTFGAIYIYFVEWFDLIESIVFGFIIIEAPELLFKCLVMVELYTAKPELEKKEPIIYFNEQPNLKRGFAMKFFVGWALSTSIIIFPLY